MNPRDAIKKTHSRNGMIFTVQTVSIIALSHGSLKFRAMRWLIPDMNKPPERHPDFESWPPAGSVPKPEWEMPGWGETIWRGMRGRCPHCGASPIFIGFLTVHPLCQSCAAPLGDMPSDDAPPYIAMVVVLQVLALFVVLFYKGYYDPGLGMAGFMLVALALICMAALRVTKGAVIGILLKLGMKREVPNG